MKILLQKAAHSRIIRALSITIKTRDEVEHPMTLKYDELSSIQMQFMLYNERAKVSSFLTSTT